MDSLFWQIFTFSSVIFEKSDSYVHEGLVLVLFSRNLYVNWTSFNQWYTVPNCVRTIEPIITHESMSVQTDASIQHSIDYQLTFHIIMYVKQNTALTFANAWILQCMSNKTLHLLTPMPEYYNVCQTKHCTYLRQSPIPEYYNVCQTKHCTYLRQCLNITKYVKQNSALTYANAWI